MAGRNSYTLANEPTAPHRIETVITSRSSQQHKGIQVMESDEIARTLTTRMENKQSKDTRPRITIIGDSHARGCAGELLHRVRKQFNVMGYTKPNAGLPELLPTAKKGTSKLTKKDTVIILGGTNDIKRNLQGKNLTSMETFLDVTAHANVLVEVPYRYDLRKRHYINDDIMKYNRRISKLTQKVQKCTTNSSNN
jgi:hypothetical protein